MTMTCEDYLSHIIRGEDFMKDFKTEVRELQGQIEDLGKLIKKKDNTIRGKES